MESLVSSSKQVVMSKKRGFWKPEEDLILRNYVQTHGEGHWASISEKSGLKRGGKSCRLRWKNYLRPNIKRGSMSQEEEDLIIRMHKLLGNRWSLIAGRLPGRTDNEVKNYWNTHLNKRSSAPAKRKTNMDDQEDNKTSFAVNKRVRTLCTEGDDHDHDHDNVSDVRKEESAVTAPSMNHPTAGWMEDLMSFSYGDMEPNYAAAEFWFDEKDPADNYFMPYLDSFLLFGALEVKEDTNPTA